MSVNDRAIGEETGHLAQITPLSDVPKFSTSERALSHHPHLHEHLDLAQSSTQMYTQPYLLSLVSRVSPSVQTHSGPHLPTPQHLALRTILACPCSVLNDSNQSQ